MMRSIEKVFAVAQALLLATFVLGSGQLLAQVLWTVETPEGELNWLLGTIHSEDPRVLDFPPALEQVINDAERVALELMPDQAMLSELNQAMNLPQGKHLKDFIEPELYQRVVEKLSDYGMTESAVNRLRPWAAAMTLSLPVPETGIFMDLALAFRVASRGTEIASLETLDEQLQFLTSMGEDAHLAMLQTALEDYAEGRVLFEALITAYVERDLVKLQALSQQELAAMGEDVQAHFQQVGLNQRNQRMLKRAMPMLDQGGTLVAVGALHLPGKTGLIALLQSKGYRVEPVY
ncbi:MAG: TraB/GumN family protein [Pseudomonadota bacterium]